MHWIRSRFSWSVMAVALAMLPALIANSPDASLFAQLPKADFVPFDVHVKHLQEAKHDDYKKLPGTKVASVAHFNEMKNHLHALYKDLKVTHTFIGHDGHHVDVAAIDQQPSLRHPLLKNHKVQRTPPALRATPKAKAGKTNPTAVQTSLATTNGAWPNGAKISSAAGG